MKVAIGMNLRNGPWGGGNQFGNTLKSYLLKLGVQVVHDLSLPDLDIILLAEPRAQLAISAFTHREIKPYILGINPTALVVHRVNECDERKSTTGVNEILRKANRYADHTVFISRWLSDLLTPQGLLNKKSCVILNGADTNLFNSQGHTRWNSHTKLKLVTHHWGANHLKGFDIYKKLDQLLSHSVFREKLEFTYIGNLPKGFSFQNATQLMPQSGVELTQNLKRHHVYLTASLNEPAGMHHVEGALCGLPLLYRESGALPEYCRGFGVMFDSANFESKLKEMIATYDHWSDQIKNYSHTGDRMCQAYYDLFRNLLERRDEVLKRRIWNKPLERLKCLLTLEA